MDTVTIDGVAYVRASVLAKQHGYTTDYIGQLCRGGKVDAHLVGRTWYVYPATLDGHKNTRYAELRSNEKRSIVASEKTSSRVNVNKPISKNTLRSQPPRFAERIFWKMPKYENDGSDLIPSTAKGSESRKFEQEMPIHLAESERIDVTAGSDNVALVSEPMPAVALAGTLKVLNFAPNFDSEESDNTVDKSSYIESEETPMSADVPTRAHTDKHTYSVELHRSDTSTRPAHSRSHLPGKTRILHSSDRKVSTDSSVESLKLVKSSLPPSSGDPETTLFFRLVIAPATVVLVAVIAGALLMLESVTTVGVTDEGSTLRLNSASVTSILDGE